MALNKGVTMEKSIEECALALQEAMNLFLNYSVQLYIKQGVINANDKHALMREYVRLMSEETREFDRTSSVGQVSVFAFD